MEETQALHDAQQQDCTKGDPPVAGVSAQHEHSVTQKCDGRVKLGGIEMRYVQRQEEPCDGGERRGDRERLQLIGEHVLAQRGGSLLVLPDRPQDAAPRTRLKQPKDGEAKAEREPDDDKKRKLRDTIQTDTTELMQEPSGERAPLLVVTDDALVAAGEGCILERVADDFREGDGRNGEVVRPQAQRGRSEERRVGKECRSRWSPYH